MSSGESSCKNGSHLRQDGARILKKLQADGRHKAASAALMAVAHEISRILSWVGVSLKVQVGFDPLKSRIHYGFPQLAGLWWQEQQQAVKKSHK